ncbi:hypothetical protein [Streptomyces sp. NPDC102462]|uniref:hypothetical protein n=1 Tax=Streptomyces sp. NPDC102462 TaxID=3366178 RepID=UPI0038014697
MAEQKSPSGAVAPLRSAASAVRKVPGAEALTRAGEGILDKVESVSPRGRRLVVYTGAGVLGAVGAVEWPVALTGAAVVWLTQARPKEAAGRATTGAVTGSAAPTTAAAAPQRASTGRRAPAPTPAPKKSAPAQKKTAPAAPRGTTAKSGTSTRTTTSGSSGRTTTAKRGRTTR